MLPVVCMRDTAGGGWTVRTPDRTPGIASRRCPPGQPYERPLTAGSIVHGEVPQAEGFAARLLNGGGGSVHVPAMETSVIVFSSPESVSQPATPGRTDND